MHDMLRASIVTIRDSTLRARKHDSIMKYQYLLLLPLLMLTACKQEQSAEPAPIKTFDLTIKVKNITNRTLFATCFAYMKKNNYPRWRWHKTKVRPLLPQEETIIPITQLTRKDDFHNVYGTLGVFLSQPEAEAAIYELTPDENKVDLDKLHKLTNQTIVLGIEKYGVVGDIFDYSFFPDDMNIPEVPELDFVVENKSGKTIYATAFIYQKKEVQPIWRYDKTPVVRIASGQSKLVDVDTLTDPYDRKYMRGFLAIFDESEQEDANHSTFQLLKEHQKVNLGLLAALRDRKVIIKNQKYGILGDIIDFTVHEPRKIAFSRHDNIKNQPRYSK